MKKEHVALYAGAMVIASVILLLTATQIQTLRETEIRFSPQEEKNIGPPPKIPETVLEYYELVKGGEFPQREIKAVTYKIFNLCLQHEGNMVIRGKTRNCEEILENTEEFENAIGSLVHSLSGDIGGVDKENEDVGELCNDATYCQLTHHSPCSYKQNTAYFCNEENPYALIRNEFGGCPKETYLYWTEKIESDTICKNFNP